MKQSQHAPARSPSAVTVDASMLVPMPGMLAREYKRMGGGPVVLMGKPAPVIYEHALGQILDLQPSEARQGAPVCRDPAVEWCMTPLRRPAPATTAAVHRHRRQPRARHCRGPGSRGGLAVHRGRHPRSRRGPGGTGVGAGRICARAPHRAGRTCAPDLRHAVLPLM